MASNCNLIGDDKIETIEDSTRAQTELSQFLITGEQKLQFAKHGGENFEITLASCAHILIQRLHIYYFCYFLLPTERNSMASNCNLIGDN